MFLRLRKKLGLEKVFNEEQYNLILRETGF